ncbi:MAG: zinc-binding alcohol dehydrogenase [Caldilineaceae bacterium]|nr:zinc-binding alcohol dehydrogenase [Caldilineaceae bacterium]
MSRIGQRLVVAPNGKVTIAETQVPDPGPDQILVHTVLTQVSAGSEMNLIRRRRLATAAEQQHFRPEGLGYTSIGYVEAIGSAITDFAVGERVLCNGNHGTHWLVTPANVLKPASISQEFGIEKIPAGLDDTEAAFAVLGDIALHGVRIAQLQIGESVAIHGLGVIGLLVVQLCRLSGAHPIIGVDPLPERLAQARALGATATIHAGQDDVVARLQSLTQRPWHYRNFLPGLEPGVGAEVQLHCSSNIQIYPTMLKAAADRGRIILIGATSGAVPIEAQELFRRELTVRGSYQTGLAEPHPYWPWSRARNHQVVMDLIARGELEVKSLISHVVPACDAPDLYDLMMNGGTGWMSVFFQWS